MTDTTVASLRPKDRTYTRWDTTPAFGVQVTPAGARSWVMRYTVDGKRRQMTLARCAEVSAEDARAMALAKLADVRLANIDPLVEKAQARARRANAPTLQNVSDDWMEYARQHKRPKSQREDERMWRLHVLPALKPDTRLEDLRRSDIEALHRALGKAGKRTAANRVLSLLSAAFNRAIANNLLASNPAHGIKRFSEHGRTRYLSPEELRRLTEALAQSDNRRASLAITMMAMTGARPGEILAMRWDGLDLLAGTWTKSASTTKTKKTHSVALSGAALRVLATIPPVSQFVFPGNIVGAPLREVKKAWGKIRQEAKLDGVRLHDLRHTFASYLLASGATLPVIGGLLGHSSPAMTSRYAHLDLSAMRRALAEAPILHLPAPDRPTIPEATAETASAK